MHVLNCSSPENMTKLSTVCLESKLLYELNQCRPTTSWFDPIALGWTVFSIVLGVLGNLMTLLAIPYAAKHKRYYKILG